MILPKNTDALHKSWLYRLLINLIDDVNLGQQLYFKGGTGAALLGWLDRFSVDLDFDLAPKTDKKTLRRRLYSLFKQIGLTVKDESRQTLQFFLKYPTPKQTRNTLKLEILSEGYKANDYQPQWLAEISRLAICQTKETMVANKLVAVTERFKKHKSIAGRDIYDVHYFLSHGFSYKKEIIKERTGLEGKKYFVYLKKFIEQKVTRTIINQDINTLLPHEQFKAISKTLKEEVLMLLGEEIKKFIAPEKM